MTRFRIFRLLLAAIAVSLAPFPAQSQPESQDVFTNFEGIIPNTSTGEPFDVGAFPDVATFGGDAFAGFVGNPALYRSGIRSWMVVPNGSGTIEFPELAAEVEFYAVVLGAASGATMIRAFDAVDEQVGSTLVVDPGTGFQLASFSGSIAAIEVENLDGAQLNGIDDFGFTPLPEPGFASMAMLGFLLVILLGSRWGGPRSSGAATGWGPARRGCPRRGPCGRAHGSG